MDTKYKKLTEGQKSRLTISVLEGDSYTIAAGKFGVSKQTAHDICKRYYLKIFPLITEREALGINFNDIKSLRRGWGKVSQHIIRTNGAE